MDIRFEDSLGGFLKLNALGLACLALNGCAPGYVNARELDQRDQGPSACNKSCLDLGMHMVAMVLVGDTLPGCVCQVLPIQAASPAATHARADASNPAGAPTGTVSSTEGAAASATGYVVIAAAAAMQEQEEEQRRRQQQEEHRHPESSEP
jgi:hypothetical protein